MLEKANVGRFLRKNFGVLITAAALSLTLPLHAHERILTGVAIHIADGDTITVLDDSDVPHKVRLAGIDAPELKQPYGQASRKNLYQTIIGRPVRVEWHKHDKYGRIVGKVILGLQDICMAQIHAGLAWHYKKYMREQPAEDRRAYAAAEEQARRLRRGLWAEAAIPPWEFRQRKVTERKRRYSPDSHPPYE